MEKPRPIWQDLPRHLKTYVAENLGDKSRQSLGQCSKMDREIIQGIPFLMKSVVIGSKLIESNEMANRKFTTYQYESEKGEESLQKVIDDVINIVRHPKSIIGSITFNLEPFQGIFYPNLVEKLKTQNLKIRAKKVYFNGAYNVFRNPKLKATHLELLELLDPKVLEMIDLFYLVDGSFKQLVKTEQWKNAKGVSINVEQCNSVGIENFFHFEKMNIRGFKKLNDENKMKMIENFQAHDLPVHSFFFISSYGVAFPLAMIEKLSEKEYEMPTPGNKLLVEVNHGMIQGRVVNENENSNINQLLYQLHC